MKTRSQIIVEMMMEKDPRIQRKGFNKAMLKAFAADTEEVIDDDIEYLKQFLGPVPDAWLIDAENKAVVWYEVEDTHRLTDDKLLNLYYIAFALDYCFWSFHLIVVDRHANSRDFQLFEEGIRLAYGNKQSGAAHG